MFKVCQVTNHQILTMHFLLVHLFYWLKRDGAKPLINVRAQNRIKTTIFQLKKLLQHLCTIAHKSTWYFSQLIHRWKLAEDYSELSNAILDPGYIMLRDLFTLILLYKKPKTGFEYPRACRFRKPIQTNKFFQNVI
jgi:hypothetical protein